MDRVVARHGDRERERTLPVNLLLKGRLCLVVGAGNVAHRTVRNLLAHGAQVVLAAPEVVPELRDLAAAGRISIKRECYDPSLLDGWQPFLVYAATDDDPTNRRIVTDARERGLLASSASCWEEGDFISPSVIQWGRGQVSITTEGASCRQARFMRLRLQELLGGERQLFLLGVDQRTLSLGEFERVRPDAVRQQEILSMLRHLAALEEFVLLATCNRLELYAWTRPEAGLERAIRHLLGLEAVGDRVYVKTAEDVVVHAANVVAGHFSELVCETQITGQFKEAFRRAFAEDVAGVHMQVLHDEVLQLGRRIRARQGMEVDGLPEQVAEEIARRRDTFGARVLVLGAGALGREVADRLADVPGLDLSWGNRTLSHLPEAPACRRLSLAEALGRLDAFDVVVCVLGAGAPVVRAEHLCRNVPLPVFFDLGLPRNVDPRAGNAAGVKVFDLSHFQRRGVDRDRLVALADAVVRDRGAVHG